MRYSIFSIFIFLTIAGQLGGQPNPELKVGEQAPPIKALKWLKGNPVNYFEKGRLYLVEFGSTWCVPCAAAIPELTAIAEEYRSDLTVISFFVMERNTAPQNEIPSYVSRVEKYLAKQGDKIRYAVAVDDPEKTMENTWLKAAGRTGIPHIFLIDRNSKIAWIGSNPSAAKKILDRMIDPNESIPLSKAVIEAYRNLQSKTNTSRLQNALFFSSLSLYSTNQKALYHRPFISSPMKPKSENDQQYQVEAVGFELTKLFYLAYGDTLWNQLYTRSMATLKFPDTIKHPYQKRSYGKYWYEPLLETRDPAPFKERYNYTLKFVDVNVTAQRLKAAMQHDLHDYFGYDVAVETRVMPCWDLIIGKTKKLDALKAANQQGQFEVIENNDGSFTLVNATTRDIIWMLGSNYGYLDYDYGKMPYEDQLPFIDRTGIEYQIDFTFHKDYNFEEFRNYLTTLGLDVIRSSKKMKVVVIKDPGT